MRRCSSTSSPARAFPLIITTGRSSATSFPGSVYACGRRIVAGDFHHADGHTDHGELWTEEGCRVLLVVQPEDYFPAPIR